RPKHQRRQNPPLIRSPPTDSRFCRNDGGGGGNDEKGGGDDNSFVIPAKAGIQRPSFPRKRERHCGGTLRGCLWRLFVLVRAGGTLTLCANVLDSRFRGNDDGGGDGISRRVFVL
ncbi:MAG: hypothetical protein ACR2P4_00840, partial [Gammaproteobacteria bacterium]